MSLADAAEERKTRLLALRQRKDGEGDVTGRPVLRNRNFDSNARTLKKRGTEDVHMEDTVEKNVEGLAATIIKEDEQRRAQELDIFNIAPKRPNWDLRRETDKKIAKLERKTQEAIHTLIRQRLAAQKGDSDDIVGAMNAQQKAQAEEDVLSDDE